MLQPFASKTPSAVSTTKKSDLLTAAENMNCLLHLQAVSRGWGALPAVLHPQHRQGLWEVEEGRKRGQHLLSLTWAQKMWKTVHIVKASSLHSMPGK